MPDKTCFVMMPCTDNDNPGDNIWDDLFNNVIQPAVECNSDDPNDTSKSEYTCIRSMDPHGSFMRHAVEHISKSPIAIAVLTNARPNVMYELGIRHALKRKTIMLVDKTREDDVPTDLNAYVVVRYSIATEKGKKELRDTIRKRILAIDTTEAESDSPVSDFLEREAWKIRSEWDKNQNPELFFPRLAAVLPSYAFDLEPVLQSVSEYYKNLKVRAEKNAEAIKNATPENASLEVKREAEAVAKEGQKLRDIKITLAPSILHNMAFAAVQRGDHTAASVLYEQITIISPKDATAWSNRGGTLTNLGRYEEAIKSFEKAIGINPKYARAWSNQGTTLYKLGRHEEAIQNYDKAIELNPKYAAAWSNRGNALSELGKFEEAIKNYEKAIELDPQYAQAWNSRGNTLNRIGKFEEALKNYEKAIELDPQYATAWYNRGVILGELGKFDEALKNYEKAIELDPQYAQAWNNRGSTLNELGKFDEAQKNYEKAIELDPKLPPAWNNRGNTLNRIGKFEEALKNYEKAIELDPQYAAAWSNRGNALSELGKFEEAIKNYEKAIELDPQYAQAWSQRGYTLFFLRQFGEAASSFQSAINLNIGKAIDEMPYNNLGFCLEVQGMNEEALSNYERAIELKPDFTHALFNKGSVLRKMGKIEEAESFRLQALKIDPNVENEIMGQKKTVGLE